MYFLTFSFLLVLSEIDQIRKLNKEKWDKINLAIELIDEWLGIYKYELNSFVTSDQPDKVEVTQRSIDRLEKIKKTLED